MTRDFKWDEVVEIIDDMEPVTRLGWRHGWRDCYVFEVDGEHWQIEILNHLSEGWQKIDPVKATRVTPIQVQKTEWVPV